MTIDRLFEYKYDERVRKLKIETILLQICSIVSLCACLFFFYVIVKPSYYSNTNVDYSELTQSERKIAYSIVNDLKTDYLHLAKNIRFVKNESEFSKRGHVGENFFNGEKIMVLYDEDIDWMREVVCHELVHTSIKLNYDLEERIVKDIGGTNVCYR